MAKPRTFDWDEAKRRYEAGETQTGIAKEYGVSVQAVWWACHPDKYKESFARNYAWSRANRRFPCLGGCGKLVWLMSLHWSAGGQRGDRSGLCMQCLAKQQREQAIHGTEGVYKWCKCDLCRAAGTAAKRKRREATRVPCSHGCGTMVDSLNRRNPEKPPECQPCSVKRLKAEGRLGVRA